MKIENNRYVISQDKYNYILQMKTTIKDSHLLEDKSKIGEVKLGEKLFFGNIAQVFKRIVDLELATSDEIKSMLDVSIKIDEIANELREGLFGAPAQGTKGKISGGESSRSVRSRVED